MSSKWSMNRLTSAFPRPIDLQLSSWNVVLDNYELTTRGICIPFDYFIRNCNRNTLRLLAKNAMEMGDRPNVWKHVLMYINVHAREDISNWVSARFIFALLYCYPHADVGKLDRFNRCMTEVVSTADTMKTLLNEAQYLARLAMN